jgi:hypothetical protein
MQVARTRSQILSGVLRAAQWNSKPRLIGVAKIQRGGGAEVIHWDDAAAGLLA